MPQPKSGGKLVLTRSNVFSGDTQRRFLVQLRVHPSFGAGQFEFVRNLRRPRNVGGERLNAQAAIQIRRQQSAYPPHVFLAALHPVLAAPQSDNGDEPRFMVCDHHETPGEPGYFSERSINRSGQGCVYFVRFIRLGNKLDAESGDALVLKGFESSGRDTGLERLWVSNERDTEPPNFLVLPGLGEAHPRGSRSDSDAPWWDTRGDRGTVPSQQDAQEYDGFLQRNSAGGRHFVSPIQPKMGKIAPGR